MHFNQDLLNFVEVKVYRMKRKLFIFLALICCVQLLWAQEQPMVFQPVFPHQHWNKYIVLFPEGVYFTTRSHLGTRFCWGEWVQKSDTIYFKHFPQAYSEKDLEFKLGYKANLQGQTIVTTNKDLLAIVRNNSTTTRIFPFGGENKQVNIPYQVDSIGIVHFVGRQGESIKSIGLYDSINSRYNNVVKITMKEDSNFPYDATDNSFKVVDNERLIELESGINYVRMDSVRTAKYLKGGLDPIYTEALASAMAKSRENRAVIPYNLPEAREVYNPDTIRFMRKFEHNRRTITAADLEQAVLKMFGEVARLPNERVLRTEDEYILFVNYLCQATETNEKVWHRAYVQLWKDSEKQYRLIKYIKLLPEEEQSYALKMLLTSLAHMQTVKTGKFDIGNFHSSFGQMMIMLGWSEYSKYIKTNYN